MAIRPQSINDLPQVVYDEHGNKIEVSQLQTTQAREQPQVVYMARPHEPIKPHVSESVKRRHDEAKRLFPYLNLSDGEYVISYVKRHVIGLIEIWAGVFAVVALLTAGIVFVVSTRTTSSLTGESQSWLALVLLGAIVFTFVIGIIATVVYEGNKFFLTNESVTQHIQISLFSKKEQTISLGNIEDASFRQHGLLQTFFNYGSLRLSTEGDETTYRFNFVANPGYQVATLNNAVEAFKNGRPIDPDES